MHHPFDSSQQRPQFTPTRRAVITGLAAAAAAGGPALAADRKLQVAGVYSVPVDQQWASRIHIALKAAEARGDIEYGWSESVPNTDMERVLRDWAQKGSDLLIGDTFPIERAARKVAADFKKSAFLMGSSLGPAQPNFAVFDNTIQDASYLTGIVAGGLTKTNVIGMVGGYAIPEVNRLMNGFMAGAREINPAVRFRVSFIGSWFDPAKAKETAFAQIDQGADVLYAERTGVSDAAKARGLLAVGNLVDTQAQYPETVVVSALWHMEPTIDRALTKLRAGTFAAEDYGPYSTMPRGGASISPFGTFETKVPAEIKAKVAELEAAIRNGAFQVQANDQEPKSS